MKGIKLNGNGKAGLVALIVLIGMTMAFVVGISLSGKVDEGSTPLITTVLGFVSLAVVALVANLNAERTRETAQRTEEKVDKVLNGAMDEKIRKGVETVLSENGVVDRRTRSRDEPPHPPAVT